MKIELYIVQSEHGGVPEEPYITTSKLLADRYYLNWWKEELDEPFTQMKDLDKLLETYDGDNFCRYWIKSLTLNVEA